MTQTLSSSRIVVALVGFSLLLSVFFGFSTLRAEAATTAFTTQMELGSRGTQVTLLQRALASDPTIYPQGIVSGYFGFLTKSAVSNFQSHYGLPAVGRVGPQTLAKLNQVVNEQGVISMGDISAPIIFNASIQMSSNSAVASWSTNEVATGRVYYSTSPLQYTETMGMPIVSGSVVTSDSIGRTSQSLPITGLSSNTTYYFMFVTSDPSGNVTVTWPSTFKTNS